MNIPIHISAFHTLFNFFNIVLLIPFVPQIAKLVERLVRPEEGEEKVKESEYRFEFITTGIMRAPEIPIYQARKEIIKMSILSYNMFQTFLDIFFHPNKKMGAAIKKIEDQENLADKMKDEITRYLARVSRQVLTDKSSYKVTSLMRIVNEIESIADCCYDLVLSIRKKHDENLQLHPTVNEEIKEFSHKVIEFMEFNIENLQTAKVTEEELRRAIKLEISIDDARDELRENSVKRIRETGKVETEMLFMNIIKNFERIGDYSLNISEAIKRML
jgi:phosphate:Na+ symporter